MKRKNNQAERITQSLKRDMLDGRYQAGSRLPTRLELQSTFEASPVTLQKVINRLIEEGFLLTRGRQGTFVSETPSHLHRIGLLFEMSQGDVESSIFLDGLRKCAGRVEQASSLSFDCFYDLKRGMAAPDAVRLMQQIESHRLCGLFIAHPPYGLRDTPALRDPTLPRVMIESGGHFPDIPRIVPISCVGEVVDYLIARGCRTAALAYASRHAPSGQNEFVEQWRNEAREKGLRIPSEWCVPAHPDLPLSARVAMPLLLRPGGERPNAVIIADDNLVSEVTAGILSTGLRVPDDLVVCAHCNYPFPPTAFVPVKQFGFDLMQLVETAAALLRSQREGQTVPLVTEIRGRLGAEWSTGAETTAQAPV